MNLEEHELREIFKQLGACESWKGSVDKLIVDLQKDFFDIRDKIDCIYKKTNGKLSLRDIGYIVSIVSIIFVEFIKAFHK